MRLTHQERKRRLSPIKDGILNCTHFMAYVERKGAEK
jgi:hypothetical protein